MSERFTKMCDDLVEIDRRARNIRYFNILFGNRNEQMHDYSHIQLIFARWRREFPVYYTPLIDFYQEQIDAIAPMIEKPTFSECVTSYRPEHGNTR